MRHLPQLQSFSYLLQTAHYLHRWRLRPRHFRFEEIHFLISDSVRELWLSPISLPIVPICIPCHNSCLLHLYCTQAFPISPFLYHSNIFIIARLWISWYDFPRTAIDRISHFHFPPFITSHPALLLVNQIPMNRVLVSAKCTCFSSATEFLSLFRYNTYYDTFASNWIYISWVHYSFAYRSYLPNPPFSSSVFATSRINHTGVVSFCRSSNLIDYLLHKLACFFLTNTATILFLIRWLIAVRSVDNIMD